MTRDSSLARKSTTLAMSSGLGHLDESACGFALRLAAAVPMIEGRWS